MNNATKKQQCFDFFFFFCFFNLCLNTKTKPKRKKTKTKATKQKRKKSPGAWKNLVFGRRLTVKGGLVEEWSEMGVGGNGWTLELRHQARHPPTLLLPLPLLSSLFCYYNFFFVWFRIGRMLTRYEMRKKDRLVFRKNSSSLLLPSFLSPTRERAVLGCGWEGLGSANG